PTARRSAASATTPWSRSAVRSPARPVSWCPRKTSFPVCTSSTWWRRRCPASRRPCAPRWRPGRSARRRPVSKHRRQVPKRQSDARPPCSSAPSAPSPSRATAALTGRPLTVELFPAFARYNGAHPWRATVRVRFLLAQPRAAGGGTDVRVVPGGRAVIPVGRPPELALPEGFTPLIEVRIHPSDGVGVDAVRRLPLPRSEEHTSELQS